MKASTKESALAKRTELPHRVLAEGLDFPEGPLAMSDGSILVVEVRGPRVKRVSPDGSVQTLTEWPSTTSAGPNGIAIGPDEAVYVCNNGGFAWYKRGDYWLPSAPGTGAGQSPEYKTGSIDRLDLSTGEVSVLYTACDGHRLCGPNDLVFDADGGMWFTDFGKTRAHDADRAGVFYATIDGSFSRRAIFPLLGPNGIGLSPDGGTLYVSETLTGRLWAWDVTSPGRVNHRSVSCLANTLGHFDSLAVEANGTVVVAALSEGLCLVGTDGEISYVDVPDGDVASLATNVCWGGEGLTKAYVTDAGGGRLLEFDWPRPGLRLNFNA